MLSVDETCYSCGVVWSIENYPSLASQLSYVAYIYTLGFFLPLAVIFSSYYKIGKTIRQKVSATSTILLFSSCHTTSDPVGAFPSTSSDSV